MMFRTGSSWDKTCIIAGLLACAFAGCMLFAAPSTASAAEKADFAGIKSVCELSTLKCYYHNVAEVDDPGKWPFSEVTKIGRKRIWIEYSGIVTIGIDASKVTISEPDENGVVQVHVPEVEILDTYLDKQSLSDPITEAGPLTEITAEEKMAGISAAQDNMKQTASENQALYTQAYDRARRVIKAYVTNVGDAVGEEYTVEWV